MEADLGEIIVLNKALNEREHTNILSYFLENGNLQEVLIVTAIMIDSFDDFPSGLLQLNHFSLTLSLRRSRKPGKL